MDEARLLNGQLPEHDPADMMAIFNALFMHSENTRLIRGDSEPVYLPADEHCGYHQVVFAHGFFASALHEIAHWCIAGTQRRELLDYGYWYAPDGRTAEQQRAFEIVEVEPQALEWILSKACGKSFRISVDNLNGVATDASAFKRAVFQQVNDYCKSGIPPRAILLRDALVRFYHTPVELNAGQFDPAEIGLSVADASGGTCS